MTSLTTRRRPPPTADADRRRPGRTHPRRRRTGSGATPWTWARCRARATSGRPSASPTSSPWSTSDQLRYRPEDPHWEGRDRFLLSIGPLRDRAVRGAGRGRHHPGRGAGDLRVGRLPAADVGDGILHPGMEISGGSLGHGLAVAVGMALGLRHQGNPARVVQPAVRRRARRGLHLGGGDGRRPPRPGQRDRASSTSTPCRPTARPTGCCAPSRSPTSGGRSAGTPCGSTATTSPPWSTPSTSSARTTAARGGHLRHPHRPRRAAAGNPGEGALHAHRRTRVAARPRPARRSAADNDDHRLTPTTPPTTAAAAEEAADHLGDDRLLRRRRAEDRPRTVRARPGRAGRGEPGDRRAVRRPGQVHRHAHLPRRPPGAVLPDGHGRAGRCSAPPPGWPRSG